MKKIFCLLISAIWITLAACGNDDYQGQFVLKVGTIAGPETELMETAKQLARERYQMDLKIIQFSDYVLPNIALNDGSIDVNIYQHRPYLDTAIALHQYPFTAIGKTFIYPMALYSTKIKSLKDLKPGATIVIPNDPSNGSRALLLLEDAGLIKLKPKKRIGLVLTDIDFNPKQYVIKQLDAAQLPRVLPDVDLAAINTNYAVDAGYLPKRDGLFVERADSPYANVIVIRSKDKGDHRFKMLLDVMHSREVQAHAQKLFHDQAIAAW